MPIGVDGSGNPTNIFPKGLIDPLAARLSALFPAPNVNINGSNFLAEPKKTYSRNNADVRIDQKITDRDNLFGTFSYEDQPSFTPSPFQNELDGGAFSDGYENDSFRAIAVSETHVFSPNLVNEFRLGYNRINTHRFQLNYNTNVSANLGFPGVPFGPNIGGLPQISINDGTATLGSASYLPAIEKQNTYILTDNVTLVHGRHSFKLGAEIRHQEFTLFEPAAPRGTLGFGSDFTDNPASPTSGGEAYATFLLGVPDSGEITSLHTVDYHRPVYGFYAEDDIRATPRMTLNLGLRYDLFTTVKARGNQQANFDFSSASLIVPAGQTATLTPFLAANIPIQRTAIQWLDSARPNQLRAAPRHCLPNYQQTGDARGIWHFLRRRRKWTVFESQPRIQSSVLCNSVVLGSMFPLVGESGSGRDWRLFDSRPQRALSRLPVECSYRS